MESSQEEAEKNPDGIRKGRGKFPKHSQKSLELLESSGKAV